MFTGLPVPGCPEDVAAFSLTMLVAHPSAMRKGAVLEARARAVPIAPVSGLRKSEWSNGHYDVYPLPLLAQFTGKRAPIANRSWGAILQLAAPIPTSSLSVKSRLVCLSPLGLHLLLQRLVHSDTRVAVKLSTLKRVFQPKLEEMELLESWVEELLEGQEGGNDFDQQLLTEANEFESFLQTTSLSDVNLRTALDKGERLGDVRRAVMREIKRRAARD